MTNRAKSAVQFIGMFIDSLVDCRGKTHYPEELEWEIRVYEFMLKDPVKRLELYQNTRMPELAGSKYLSKRETVKKLGWEIL